MANLVIVYHSGYGHTAKVAEHVRKGAASVPGIHVSVLKADDLTNSEAGPWDALVAADAIVFGSPTYMGSASAVMKQFMEASSKFWFTLGWKDKIAAGFTNAGSLSGDKNETLHQFATFAAQHGMVWVSFGTHPGYNSTKTDFASARNRTGHALGLATQSLVDLPAEQTPDAADLATAEDFGARVALATQRWVRGRV